MDINNYQYLHAYITIVLNIIAVFTNKKVRQYTSIGTKKVVGILARITNSKHIK